MSGFGMCVLAFSWPFLVLSAVFIVIGIAIKRMEQRP